MWLYYILIFMAMWKEISSGGSKSNGAEMYIRLYPNYGGQYGNCSSGSYITSTLTSAMNQLLNWDSIGYYQLSRFNVSDYNYPEVDASSGWSTIANEFEDFLKNSNGTGDNLKNAIGAHTLIHGGGCSHNDGTASYEDMESNDLDCSSYSSFTVGRMAWSGVCSDIGLREASAVQEPLHTFIRWHHPSVKSMLGDHDENDDIWRYDEHSLGKVNYDGYITPMLTYHQGDWSDNASSYKSDCQDDTSLIYGYTANLTSCTKRAVDYITSDLCQ